MRILIDKESVAKENNELKRYFDRLKENYSGLKIIFFWVHSVCRVADRGEQAAEARNRKHPETRFDPERLMISFIQQADLQKNKQFRLDELHLNFTF